MFSHPNSSSSKRKPFVDLTNISSDNEETLKSDKKYENMDMMPLISHEKGVTTDIVGIDGTRFQNVHPLLGWYKHDLLTVHIHKQSRECGITAKLFFLTLV